MRKFQYISMLLFIQMSMLMTGFIEVSEGHFLYSAYKNTLLGDRMIAVGNSLEDLYAYTVNSRKSDLITSQDIYIGIANTNVKVLSGFPSPAGLIDLFATFLNVFLNICVLIFAVFIQLVVGSFAFYQMIILALLPQGTQSVYYSAILAGFLSLMQTFVLLIDLMKSVKGGGVASLNALFDLEGGGGSGGSGGRRRNENKKLTDFT